MSINFKVAALALGVTSLFSAGQANAADCDGSVQQQRNGRTNQCYYLPTVSNGRVAVIVLAVAVGVMVIAVWALARMDALPAGQADEGKVHPVLR